MFLDSPVGLAERELYILAGQQAVLEMGSAAASHYISRCNKATLSMKPYQ